MTTIHYRAVHTQAEWRRVNSHKSLQNAIEGKDGAAGLFAGTVRINYSKLGNPLYVFIWEEGSNQGWMVYPLEGGIGRKCLPLHLILALERSNGGTQADFDRLMEYQF